MSDQAQHGDRPDTGNTPGLPDTAPAGGGPGAEPVFPATNLVADAQNALRAWHVYFDNENDDEEEDLRWTFIESSLEIVRHLATDPFDVLRGACADIDRYAVEQFAGDRDEPIDGYNDYDERMVDFREALQEAAETVLARIDAAIDTGVDTT